MNILVLALLAIVALNGVGFVAQRSVGRLRFWEAIPAWVVYAVAGIALLVFVEIMFSQVP
jgi:hypothetical protein